MNRLIKLMSDINQQAGHYSTCACLCFFRLLSEMHKIMVSKWLPLRFVTHVKKVLHVYIGILDCLCAMVSSEKLRFIIAAAVRHLALYPLHIWCIKICIALDLHFLIPGSRPLLVDCKSPRVFTTK
jgi:hypothetical protein